MTYKTMHKLLTDYSVDNWDNVYLRTTAMYPTATSKCVIKITNKIYDRQFSTNKLNFL